MRADVGSVHLMLSNSACRYIHCIAPRESLTSNVAVFDVLDQFSVSGRTVHKRRHTSGWIIRRKMHGQQISGRCFSGGRDGGF